MPVPTNTFERKIASPQTLAAHLRHLRAIGKTVVQCHGCFDIVHPGHIRYLQFARDLGDVLVVSLTGDTGVDKGLGRPYIPQELRAENLAAIGFVDWVVIDPHPTACELLDLLRPNVFVKGHEYATSADPRFVREKQIVEKNGGRVVFSSGDVVFSSTRLIQSMGRDEPLEEQRLRVFCQRNRLDAAALRAQMSSFSGLKVVVVGDVIAERYVLCDPGEAAGDAPMLNVQQLGSAEYWGGAAAIAMQLKALGAEPRLISNIGRDPSSLRLIEKLDDAGISTRFLHTRPRLVERNSFLADETKLLRVTDGHGCPLDSVAERQAASNALELMEDAKLLIWCDHGYGAVTPGLVDLVAPIARRTGVFSAGHAPGARAALTTLTHTDLLCATERQLRDALHDMSSSLPAIAWNLLYETDGRSLFVALRRRGLLGLSKQAQAESSLPPARLTSEFLPALAGQYVDPLGVDEAVLAAAALVLATGGTTQSALYFASAIEALSTRRVGIRAVTAQEVSTWLSDRPELGNASRFHTESLPAPAGQLNKPPTLRPADNAASERPSNGAAEPAPAAMLLEST